MPKISKRLKKAIETKNFDIMYDEFKSMYDIYSIEMTRHNAFKCALIGGLIDLQTYYEAKAYYDDIWYYGYNV